MLKLTKTGIGLLTRQYKSVLMKCLLLNLYLINIPITALADLTCSKGWDTYLCGFDYIEFNSYSEYNWYGGIKINDKSGTRMIDLSVNGENNHYGSLFLYYKGNNTTSLTANYFMLNSSSAATGIDFASNVTAGTTNASHLATTGSVTQLLSNNYYRKNKKSGILNGVKEGKIGNEIGDNFSKFRADNDNFAITTFLRAI